MDVNRDEAERCLELAERALREARPQVADKYARKAQRLWTGASSRAAELIAAAATATASANTNAGTNTNGSSNAPGEAEARKRRTSGSRAEDSPPEHTQQQLEAVRQVEKCKDYYEVLGVSKEAPDTEIKKAYKKLALVLHPDKNKAPGASEAFKTVGNAAATLLDAEKRKMYDTCGPDERSPRRPTHHHHYAYGRAYEPEFTAEEFFNMFFSSAGTHVYTRRGPRYQRETFHQNREAQGNYASVLQMLPILGLILLSMMSTFFISDPIYSLNPNHKFSVMRKTEHYGVPYYVKENFHNEYQGSLRRLEMSVEEEYVTNLRIACQRERTYRDNMAWKARNIDKQQFNNNIKMPSCEALSSLLR